MASGGLVEGVARDGTQYEPEVYQPSGQVPTLITGVVSSSRSSVPVMNELLRGCQCELLSVSEVTSHTLQVRALCALQLLFVYEVNVGVAGAAG
jgi:hypothetical protein